MYPEDTRLPTEFGVLRLTVLDRLRIGDFANHLADLYALAAHVPTIDGDDRAGGVCR